MDTTQQLPGQVIARGATEQILIEVNPRWRLRDGEHSSLCSLAAISFKPHVPTKAFFTHRFVKIEEVHAVVLRRQWVRVKQSTLRSVPLVVYKFLHQPDNTIATEPVQGAAFDLSLPASSSGDARFVHPERQRTLLGIAERMDDAVIDQSRPRSESPTIPDILFGFEAFPSFDPEKIAPQLKAEALDLLRGHIAIDGFQMPFAWEHPRPIPDWDNAERKVGKTQMQDLVAALWMHMQFPNDGLVYAPQGYFNGMPAKPDRVVMDMGVHLGGEISNPFPKAFEEAGCGRPNTEEEATKLFTEPTVEELKNPDHPYHSMIAGLETDAAILDRSSKYHDALLDSVRRNGLASLGKLAHAISEEDSIAAMQHPEQPLRAAYLPRTQVFNVGYPSSDTMTYRLRSGGRLNLFDTGSASGRFETATRPHGGFRSNAPAGARTRVHVPKR